MLILAPKFRAALFAILAVPTLHAQEYTAYVKASDEPTTPDSATMIKKATFLNGKYHALEYRKSGTAVIEECDYLDSTLRTKDGPYKFYYEFGTHYVIDEGTYTRGKKTGLWLEFQGNGAVDDSTLFDSVGHLCYSRSWYDDGKLKDVALVDTKGQGTSVGYWPDGRTEHTGTITEWKKTGVWHYYSNRGLPCSDETMADDTAASALFYDQNGMNPQPAEWPFERIAEYPGGPKAWQAYVIKEFEKVEFPKEYFDGKIFGRAVIQFVVDAEGNVSDVSVRFSDVGAKLTRIAVNTVEHSQHWIPALQHNRYVKAYRVQPFFFPRYTDVAK